MSSFAEKRRAFQQAQENAETVNTPAARREWEDARQALKNSSEAASARRQAGRVRLSPW